MTLGAGHLDRIWQITFLSIVPTAKNVKLQTGLVLEIPPNPGSGSVQKVGEAKSKVHPQDLPLHLNFLFFGGFHIRLTPLTERTGKNSGR